MEEDSCCAGMDGEARMGGEAKGGDAISSVPGSVAAAVDGRTKADAL